ncbi:hypothetical protein AN478_05510 [Thiohalorhabdus denitrificans]|uniref:Tfp pilus assembly protein PilX n=1 Tax=Thiohalorhabdus denitrificans TaxID=381306 RepID=A0A0P9CNF0_9GAMM|nr:hypothetical protein [Thiohalorhabdus denitrificans]KPV40627.1 hypothetical protein AN478_05510 [Thiohalorhabdus denitrificans]SCY49064.1 Tfp pilus assembly protein PilX [Thiohalorhabdus denitrificans]
MSSERGVALVTVMVVLASLALLIAGVYSLVTEGTRSARDNVHFQSTRSLSNAGLQHAASVADSVCRLGFFPDAPAGAGVQWSSLADFASYLRGTETRSGGGGPDPCTQGNPDIQYQDPASGIQVRACVYHREKGIVAGAGSGPVFTQGAKGKQAVQNLFEITVWAEGPREVLGQYQAAARYFTSN